MYLFNVIPDLGHIITGDRDSYQYFIESIQKFPNQKEFTSLIQRSGFQQVNYENHTFGVVSIHSGYKL
jgi:ubiquinone/menaquinone biosynthesis C-methylase UbiE